MVVVELLLLLLAVEGKDFSQRQVFFMDGFCSCGWKLIIGWARETRGERERETERGGGFFMDGFCSCGSGSQREREREKEREENFFTWMGFVVVDGR